MNPSHSFSAAAEDQAALWAARLDGSTLTAADRNALDAWLAADPSHRALLSSYCQFSADLEQQLPALVEAGTVALPAAKSTPRATARRTTWFASLAFAAAALVVFGVWFAQPSRHFQTIATHAAHRQSITLADGTRVELNARTQLVVENGKTERRVRLTEGEAFFQVSKDPTRPFIVQTPSGSVRVTGTTFNVRTESPTALDVLVVEGSVQVSNSQSGSAPVALHANDHLSSVNRIVTVQSLSAQDVENALAWRQGKTVLRDTPLTEALARFARYHGRSISASPAAAAAGFKFSSTSPVSLDDIDALLIYLIGIKPDLRVATDSHGAVVVKLRGEP